MQGLVRGISLVDADALVFLGALLGLSFLMFPVGLSLVVAGFAMVRARDLRFHRTGYIALLVGAVYAVGGGIGVVAAGGLGARADQIRALATWMGMALVVWLAVRMVVGVLNRLGWIPDAGDRKS